MRNITVKSAFILILFTLVSCATNKTLHSTAPVYITNTKTIHILPTEAMKTQVDSLQLLNGKFGDTVFSLFVYLQADENGLYMSLLNDFGTDMGSLSYDGSIVEFSSSIFPPQLKAEYIICDIQNAYYDAEQLEENYRAAGLIFEEEVQDNFKIRRIKNGKKIIEQITINNNSIKIQNILRGYEYNLTEGEE